jgi:hypothetical protein
MVLEPRKHRQRFNALIKAYKRIMSFSLSVRKIVAGWCSMVAIPAVVFGQGSFVTTGSEYPITGRLPGDQVHPSISFTTNGGYITWQDNWIDADGLGVGAMRLESDLTSSRIPIRVNSLVADDQENPQVSMLNNSGAVFAWQGGKQGLQHIYARFLSPSNSWLTGDVRVNSATNCFQSTPVIATLLNGNVAIVYGSANQAAPGSMMDVYLQMFAPNGNKIGAETLVNQFTSNNQRSPAITALANGSFVVAWVSEQERWTDASNGVPSVDVYARFFNSDGTPSTGEFLANVSSNICASPSLAAAPDGGFLAAWIEKDLVVRNNGWDVYARRFSALGVGGNVSRLNTQLYGDQTSPKIQGAGANYLAVWTSQGQDGSEEGVFGTFVNDDATPSGAELRVNTTTSGSQMHQAIGSDGLGRFLVAWTMLGGRGVGGFDLFGQKYINPATAVSGTDNVAFNSDPNANTNSISSTEQVILPPPVAPTTTNPPVIVRDTFNDVKGVYNGLIYDQQNGVSSATSGYATITTTTMGSFTAKMQLGGKSYSFSGQFSASGANSTTVGPWTINLQLDLHGGDVIIGQLVGGNSTLSLEANLNVFGKANQTQLAGVYTIVVQGIDSSMGNGIGTATIDSLGNVQWNMTLPDGTKLNQKTTLSKDGVWPLYAAPYKNAGVVIGWIQFPGSATNGFAGKCAWTKPYGSTAPYSGGLTNAVSVWGSSYKVPPQAFQAFGGSQVVLSGGGLSAPITNSVNWVNNKIGNLGPHKLSLSLTPTSGLFKGTVVDPSTGKTVQFQGVLYEKGNVGLGFFSGGSQNGAVSFAPNP